MELMFKRGVGGASDAGCITSGLVKWVQMRYERRTLCLDVSRSF